MTQPGDPGREAFLQRQVEKLAERHAQQVRELVAVETYAEALLAERNDLAARVQAAETAKPKGKTA